MWFCSLELTVGNTHNKTMHAIYEHDFFGATNEGT